MTSPQAPGPRPGPPPGGYRPGPPPTGPRSAPAGGYGPAPAGGYGAVAGPGRDEPDEFGDFAEAQEETRPGGQAGGFGAAGQSTGHPAVDAVLQALANAAQLAPADQIAEYEAAHQVLRETLAGIDG